MSSYDSEDDAAFLKKGKLGGGGLGSKKLETKAQYDSPSPNKMHENSPSPDADVVEEIIASKFESSKNKIMKNSSDGSLDRNSELSISSQISNEVSG